METSEKKVHGKYQKKSPSFITLHVPNFIFSQSSKPDNAKSIRFFLVNYLNSHRDSEFENQQDIAKALRQEYKLDENRCSKGAISKAISSIQGDLTFEDGTYYFKKENGVYSLRPRFSRDNPVLIELFKMKTAFLKDSVHCIGKSTVVFSVDPKQSEKVRDKLYTLLGSSLCFGIFSINEYLIVMLNEESPELRRAQSVLRDFFVRKKVYEEKRKKQKCEDAKIRQLQKKQAKSLNDYDS